jgi:hypothetical protein
VLFEKEIIMKSNDLTLSAVDTLGELLAQIAELTKQADAIKDIIKDTASAGGPKVVEGDFFKATYVECNRSTVDYKTLVSDATLSKNHVVEYVNKFFKDINANQVSVATFLKGLEFCVVDNKEIADFTKTTAVFSVKVTSR